MITKWYRIGFQAFEYCKSLTSITTPNCLTEVSSSSYRECSSLRNITIPNSVTEIGENAFPKTCTIVHLNDNMYLC